MNEPLINDVADTGIWVAAYRAAEAQQPAPLFSDPLAGLLAGDRGMQMAREMPYSANFRWAVVIRTRLIDELITRAVAEGVDQVVNLGCGLDTRPYRLELPPSLRWVEVDVAKMIALKQERLSTQTPRCRLERVAVDLSNDGERRALFARLDAGCTRMLVLTEGVIGYLTQTAVAALSDDLRALPHVAMWLQDFTSPFLAAQMAKRRRHRDYLRSAPILFTPPDFLGFFEQRGWRRANVRYYVEEAERLGRPVPLPLWMRPLLALSAKSRENVRTMMGVVTFTSAASPRG